LSKGSTCETKNLHAHRRRGERGFTSDRKILKDKRGRATGSSGDIGLFRAVSSRKHLPADQKSRFLSKNPMFLSKKASPASHGAMVLSQGAMEILQNRMEMSRGATEIPQNRTEMS
jgi:hypothetical protein